MEEEVWCPAGRRAAGLRSVMRLALGGLVLLGTWWLWQRAGIGGRGARGGLVAYSMGFVMASIGLAGVWVVASGVRWAALMMWPGAGVRFDRSGIVLRLGPFGKRSWRWGELQVVYRHEMSIDLEDPETFEDLDAESEHAARLPVIRHGGVGRRINEIILEYCAWSEVCMAERVGALIRRYRVPPE